MISAQQLASALHGTGLIYKLDQRAWDFFDLTPRGFWSAYIVALILAPLQIGHRLLIFSAEKETLPFALYAVVEVLSYIITWTLFPFVMLFIAQLLGRMPRYFAHLVPYLWVQLPMGLVLFSVQLLVTLGALPADVMDPLNLVIMAVYAIYGTFVAGIGLQVATGTAIGLVVLDYVLGLIAYQIIGKI
jgi:hypothetical protein